MILVPLLGADAEAQFANRAHFFAAAAEAMRRILIERARRKTAGKRGSHWQRLDLDKVELAAETDANTMIDGKPVPKVIDFGIAKATSNQRLTDLTLFTAFEQFIGTPAWFQQFIGMPACISPEQAEMSGLDIDTRADIYSLGVLLYELLVGQTPFDAKEMMQGGIDAVRHLTSTFCPRRSPHQKPVWGSH